MAIICNLEIPPSDSLSWVLTAHLSGHRQEALERLWPPQVAGVSEGSKNFSLGHERSQDGRIPRSVLASVMI